MTLVSVSLILALSLLSSPCLLLHPAIGCGQFNWNVFVEVQPFKVFTTTLYFPDLRPVRYWLFACPAGIESPFDAVNT